MNTKYFLALFMAAALALSLLNCADPPSSDPTLTLPNAPKTLHVNDTVYSGPAVEKTRDIQGKLTTNANFTEYHLISDDTTVVGILGLSVVGKSAGTTAVTAKAQDGTGLSSDKYTITVTVP